MSITRRPGKLPKSRRLSGLKSAKVQITSLGFHEDRLAIVIEMIVGMDGSVQDSDIYRACVRNQAKLAYDSIAAWLDGGKMPEALAAVPGLNENLRLQDKVAQRMKDLRQVHGALSFESLEGEHPTNSNIVGNKAKEYFPWIGEVFLEQGSFSCRKNDLS